MDIYKSHRTYIYKVGFCLVIMHSLLTKSMQDATRSTDYKLQVWKYGILPESISVFGVGANGEVYTRCIPYGFLRVRPEIFLPLPMARLQMTLKYGPFVLAIPNEAQKAAGDAAGFLTSFEGNMTKEACSAKGSADTVAFTQYSGSGCYIVRQPDWNTCGRTSAKATRRFLHGISGRVHGVACVDNGREECKTMNSTGSEVSISMTDDGMSQVFGFYDLQLSLDLAATQLEILSKSTYAPEHGIEVTRRLPVFTELVDVFAFINGKRLNRRSKRTQDIVGPLLPVSSVGGEQSFDIIDDGPGMGQGDFMDVAVVSSELDCQFDRTQWTRIYWNVTSQLIENMSVPSTPPDLCQLPDYKMSEVCPNGWKPTSGFRISMALLRAAFLSIEVERDHEGVPTLWLELPARCKSFENLPDVRKHMEAHWTLSIYSNHWLSFVFATKVSDETLTAEVQCQNSRCRIHVPNFIRWESRIRMASEFFISALLQDNCSLTLEDSTNGKLARSEICEAKGMATAQLCGGPTPSATINLGFQEAMLHDYKLYAWDPSLCRPPSESSSTPTHI